MEHPHQKMPLKYLEQTVARYNALAAKGADEDFEKPMLHPISTPPFYAASAGIRVLDSYGGLRINGKTQVVDTHGKSPALRRGRSSGGGWRHGINRLRSMAIAGTNAATQNVGGKRG
jgi:fumarate reductase flavoprotein subunit